MPQTSKYTDEQFEAVTNDIIASLEKHNASRDLSLMVLGNLVTQIFEHQFSSEARQQAVETFTSVLKKSIK